jgi:hypothetical protein
MKNPLRIFSYIEIEIEIFLEKELYIKTALNKNRCP